MHSEAQLKPAEIRRLITEVKNRRPLWDFKSEEYKERVYTQQLWKEVADAVGVDVEHCKRKWKNLRDAYRAEVRRYKRRADGLKAEGQEVDPKTCVSKWCYFQPMSFINESKRFRHAASPKAEVDQTSAKRPNQDENADADIEGDDLMLVASGVPKHEIKVEKNYSSSVDSDDGFGVGSGDLYYDMDMDDDLEFSFPEDEVASIVDDEEDIENDKLFEEFKAVATPQAVRRLSDSLSKSNAAAATVSAATSAGSAHSSTSESAAKTPESDEKQHTATANCRCNKQVHFLEDLEREEKKLIQSTRQEMARSDSIKHIGDSDYNFLISFWPQMKRMSELQNLNFRAKMSELMFNIMSSSSGAQHHSSGHQHAHSQTAHKPTTSLNQQQQQQQQCQQPAMQLQPQSIDALQQMIVPSVVSDVATTNGNFNTIGNNSTIYTNSNSNNWSF